MDDPFKFWNEQAGPLWVAFQEQLDFLMDPLGRELMDQAQVGSGEQVLDVGCGCGSTSIELAHRVGPTGSVVGLDISAPMLERARQRCSVPEWVDGDASNQTFSRDFDLIYSRFGLMFFDQPESAFRHLRGLLRASGRLAFLCWRSLSLNTFFHLGLQAAKPYVSLPEPTPHHLPGPFSLAPEGKIEQLLHQTGWKGIEVIPCDRHICLDGIENTADFLLKIGPVAPVVRESEPFIVDKIRQRLAELLTDLERDAHDRVLLPVATWLVTGKSR